MFRSVFAKYIAAFMSILLFSFFIIIVIIASIIGNYSENVKRESMENVALTTVSYLESVISDEETGTLDGYLSDGENARHFLQVITSADEDLCVILTDHGGDILMAVGNDAAEIADGTVMPKRLMDKVMGGESLSRRDELIGVFDEPHYLYAVPVRNGQGLSVGTVFVCASSMMITELLDVIVKTIIIASLCILVAALIAIYFISEKVVGPLRAISRAAKSFAAGKFDIRVPVRGSDEVAELAVAFNNMAESLHNYDRMRNTFLSNVSHDLRTPMTSISGFIDGILDGVIPPEKHEYYLQLVSDEVKRLSRLVTSILDLSRIEAGERKFTMGEVDICEMGRQILISFEQKIEEKALAVSFDCGADRMIALADRDAIYQALYNLCDNAVKFASEGGAFRLSIRRLKGKKLLVSVYNEGQGIADDDLPYVFERFYKSDKSRGLNKTGAGLGLYIVKTIIDAHGGDIWVDSEHGKNCCFNFTLSGE